jgi:hypothetical protein
MIDSYDSDVGVYNSATNRTDQATVSTTSTALDPVILGSSGSIYGYVATGGGTPVVGSGGMIYGATTPAGTLVDPSRIRRDFVANLPDVSAPTGTAASLAAVTHTIALPRTGDSPGANGRYLYTASSITMDAHDTVTINGPVDLIVTGNVSVIGTAGVVISSGSTPSLNLYCPGSIEIGGTGSLNGRNKATALAVWGTAASPATQSITISGTGDFIGTIYAPNANILLNGNGATNGAIIGKSMIVSGSGLFHYDTRLAGIETSLDRSFRPTSWSELIGSPTGGSAFARDNRTPFNTLF